MATVVEFLLAGFTDNSGQPLASGKVYTYAAGTTTPKAVYVDSLEATEEANPVILDSNGRKQIYANGAYKFVIKDSSDVTLYTLDNLYFNTGYGATFLGTTTGAANLYVATPTPAIGSYVDGDLFAFQAHQTNTSTATLNVSGIGAKTVSEIAGQIVSGYTYLVRYIEATDEFIIVNTQPGYATTEAEVSALNTAGVEIVIKQAITLSGNLTLTAPLRIEKGGSITTGANVLTINGAFSAGLYQVFSTALDKVVFGAASCEKVFPQWFGAIADGSTDCSDGINFAINSLETNGGIVSFPIGNYITDSTINIEGSNIILEGNNSTFTFEAETFGIKVTGVGGSEISNIKIQDLKIIQLTTASTNGNQQAIQINHANKVRFNNLYVQDWAVGIKFNDNCQYMWVEECYLKNIGEGGNGGIAIYCEGEDSTVGYENNHFFAFNNYVDGCIYGIEAKFSTDAIITGNIVENTTGSKYAFEIVRDTPGTGSTPERCIIANNIGRNLTGTGVFFKGVNGVVADNVIEDCSVNAYHLSGSNIVMSGNVAYNTNTGASIIYDSTAVKSGFETTVDTAKFIVTNNLFMLVTGSDPAISFNECSESLIANNMVYDMQGADYCIHLNSCVDTVFINNVTTGGTFGFRIDADCTGLTYRGNKSSGASSGEVSLPSTQPGWSIEDGLYQSRYFARGTTADTTPTNLKTFTIGSTNTLVHLRAKVNVKSASGAAVIGAYDIECVVKRTTGALSLTGSVATLFSAESDAGLDATFVVSSNTVSVQVTGLSATNLIWQAEIEKIESQ